MYLYMVARHMLLLFLICSARLCLGPAYVAGARIWYANTVKHYLGKARQKSLVRAVTNITKPRAVRTSALYQLYPTFTRVYSSACMLVNNLPS